MIRSPSGGAHLYYAGTEHQGNGHIQAAHVDFRSNGGYVVAPPSQVGGRPYEVVSHQASQDTFDWAKARQLLDPQPQRRDWQPRPGSGQRDLTHLARLVASKAEGGRNEALFWAACRAAEAGRTDLFTELAAAARSAGLPGISGRTRGGSMTPGGTGGHRSGPAWNARSPRRRGAALSGLGGARVVAWTTSAWRTAATRRAPAGGGLRALGRHQKTRSAHGARQSRPARQRAPRGRSAASASPAA
jgi:hypothetical protein